MRNELLPDQETLATLEAFAVDLASGAGRLIVTERPAELGVGTKSTDTDVVTEMDERAQEYLLGRIERMHPDDGVLGEEDGGSLSAGSSGLTWVLDPIDGTVNYLYGRDDFAVSVAVVVGDITTPGAWWPVAGAVAAPARGVTFHARADNGAFVVDRMGRRRRLTASSASELSQSLVATGFGYASEVRAQQASVVAALLPQVRDIRRGGSAALDTCDVAAGYLDAYYERGVHAWDIAAGRLVAEESGAIVTGVSAAAPLADGILVAAPRLHGALQETLMALPNDGMMSSQ